MIRHLKTSDGARIAYHIVGDEDATDTLVMVQGLGMPGRVWKALGQRVADEGFRVILPDNRGVGFSSLPRPPYTMARMADDIAEIMDHENLEKTYLSGVSMGGMIAQHIALRHHDRLHGLVLIATTPGLPHGRPPHPSAVRLLLRATMAQGTMNQQHLRQLLVHPDTEDRMPELSDHLAGIMKDTPTRRRAFLGQLTAVTGHNVGGQLHQIKVPTHIVVGAGDFLIPPKNSHVLAERIPSAELTVVERAGHVVPFEDPQSVVDAVLSVRRRAT